ncbi:hypothetical protein [Anaerotignum sp.]|uniref:hypothetical protein n=1 Tax=Anaerotignum sp. TaxID=2039241 RepID=UPI002897C01A|nr:hypothetical protein [Anaerotignum sp.]
MDREKVSSVMDAIAERMLRECERNNNNTEQILLLAKALNELASVRAGMISDY